MPDPATDPPVPLDPATPVDGMHVDGAIDGTGSAARPVGPRPERAYLPGYGIDTDEAGLLPWSWALRRLADSRSYWLATAHPDGRPQVTPVWALWRADCLWFSCGPDSRKARNLAGDPRATMTTDDATEPVIVEGTAVRCQDRATNTWFTEGINAKYAQAYPVEFFLANATYQLRPVRVLGLSQERFSSSPTRWRFPPVA